ncbi:unnamed protein product, partial [Staurois parvus]
HQCPAVHPTVSAPTCTPSSVSHTCAQKCHLPVPSSATHLCQPVPPTCAIHQCPSSVPSIAASQSVMPVAYQCCLQCRLSVPPDISAVYQFRLSVPPH